MKPPSGSYSPEMILNSVDFPAPFGPTNPTHVCAWISQQTLSSTIDAPQYFETLSRLKIIILTPERCSRAFAFAQTPTLTQTENKKAAGRAHGLRNKSRCQGALR